MSADLKPLYANLKRLQIGEYLDSKHFNVYAIEHDFDEDWKAIKKEVFAQKRSIVLAYRDLESVETAFFRLISHWYKMTYSFDKKILHILIDFLKWSSTPLDYVGIYENLKSIGIDREATLAFVKEARKINQNKVVNTEMNVVKQTNSIEEVSTKVFIVHGRDKIARLELTGILKDEFKLEPIVLEEQPNDSVDAIFQKFEKLARQCCMAIILLTPDDNVNENPRARQNVVLELGYFLGMWQEHKDRKIILLKKGNIEMPSDIHGVLYFEYYNDITEVFYKLKKQLQHWGF